MTQNLAPQIRKAQLLAVALPLARKHGYQNVTRAMIAEQAQVSEGLVSRVFGTMHAMRKELMRHAVKTADPIVVMQGLAARDKVALRASPEIRTAAAATI